MTTKPTFQTLKITPYPISFSNMPTRVTCLTGKSTINIDNCFANQLRLIFYELQQLCGTPVAKHFTKLFSIPFRSFYLELLNANTIKGKMARLGKSYFNLGKRFWSPSYYVGTAGHVSEKTIQMYIQNQTQQR